jgi:hypothetical protein
MNEDYYDIVEYFQDICREAAEQERAKIVAWLRGASNGDETIKYASLFADEIEAGEHLK